MLRLAALAAAIVLPIAAFAADRTKPATPEKIAHGEQVALTDFLVPGKTVIFDFTSQGCPPCRRISPKLDELHAKNADVVVVKVDINRPNAKGIDWQSPVARQYDLHSVPHFKIYNAKGKLQAEGDDAWEKLVGLMTAAGISPEG